VDRIGVCYCPFLGAELVSGELHDIWTHIQTAWAPETGPQPGHPRTAPGRPELKDAVPGL
jgi:hypothetical protein